MGVTLYLRPERGRLVPVSPLDAEELDGLPLREHRAVLTAKRSLPRHRKYWAVLADVHAATGGINGTFPTREHLHKGLLLSLGYVTPLAVPGQMVPAYIVDSTSFRAMGENEFAPYFEAALAKLAEWTGVDPLALGSEASR